MQKQRNYDEKLNQSLGVFIDQFNYYHAIIYGRKAPMKNSQKDVQGIANAFLQGMSKDYPPTPIEEIIRLSGKKIRVHESNFEGNENISGCVKKEGEIYHIILNPDQSPGRQIFTFFHELGHICLGHLEIHGTLVDTFHRAKDENIPNSYIGDKQIEQEANWFATHLLMPEKKVRMLRKEFDNVADMAKKFSVSEEAMRYRLHNLDLLGSDG